MYIAYPAYVEGIATLEQVRCPRMGLCWES